MSLNWNGAPDARVHPGHQPLIALPDVAILPACSQCGVELQPCRADYQAWNCIVVDVS